MKTYKYQNAIVYITKPKKEQIENIQKYTEEFLRKVIKEDIQNGNNNQSRDIKTK